LIELIDQRGGQLSSTDAYDALAHDLGLTEQDAERTVTGGRGQRVSAFKQRVRWARHDAVKRGLLRSAKRGVWQITDHGQEKLAKNTTGIVFTIYETELGTVLWGSAERAAGVIEPGSIDLLWTSPPYPLLQQKEYGNLGSADWLEWMHDLCGLWHPLLADTGSLVLNLGSVPVRNRPIQDPYIERLVLKLIDDLDYRLVDRHFWHNPCKPPTPVKWVAVEKVRVKNSIEHLLWLSKTDHFKANNDNVRVPESPATRKWREHAQRTGKGLGKRPGGSVAGPGFLKSNGTAIPSVLHSIPHDANRAYRQACKQEGLKPHPAMAPQGLIEFFVKLTTETNDCVYDPMAGSLTTGAVAERLGRRWLCSELHGDYLKSGLLRFENCGYPEFLVDKMPKM
uniref:site-specific DNA-methyltransferase n=1 Tax=Thalassospira sp. CH_XMU1420-2 TaxID=3107769 RepID=UPI00300ABEE7